jgi:hypothetical protein
MTFDWVVIATVTTAIMSLIGGFSALIGAAFLVNSGGNLVKKLQSSR